MKVMIVKEVMTVDVLPLAMFPTMQGEAVFKCKYKKDVGGVKSWCTHWAVV